LEDWLSTRPPKVLGIVDAVLSHVEGLGDDVVLEPTRDALKVKKARTFAEVKPRRNVTDVAFIVSRRIEDPRVLRTLDLTSRRIVHVVAVSDAAEVDEQLRVADRGLCVVSDLATGWPLGAGQTRHTTTAGSRGATG
jgi:hypothetical protein